MEQNLLSQATSYSPTSKGVVPLPQGTFAFQFGMGWSVLFPAITARPNKFCRFDKPIGVYD